MEPPPGALGVETVTSGVDTVTSGVTTLTSGVDTLTPGSVMPTLGTVTPTLGTATPTLGNDTPTLGTVSAAPRPWAAADPVLASGAIAETSDAPATIDARVQRPTAM
jgi:X-X-X-Leu-X-X-Gly heptad repeat protein